MVTFSWNLLRVYFEWKVVEKERCQLFESAGAKTALTESIGGRLGVQRKWREGAEVMADQLLTAWRKPCCP